MHAHAPQRFHQIHPEAELAATGAISADSLTRGTQPDFARYRPVSILGRGGMGTVYLAEIDEAGVTRRVALKVLNANLRTDAARRRFRQERQVLARLEHPNIARLHEGGETADGQAYLAMEYVEGLPITTYCDQAKLSIRARLALFVKMARTLAFAHQNLIVHRDIKPSNILVTHAGAPKLLDFGIAKPLEPLADSESLFQTQPHQSPMTPLYASPEQVRNQPVTVATDVYACAVVLYELLTGVSPYAKDPTTRPGAGDLLAAILSDERTAPSSLVGRQLRDGDSVGEGSTVRTILDARGEPSLDRLRGRLRGDLDVIITKALAPSPTDRYPSMEAFVDDLERHLQGLPINARAATLGYRAGKLIKRHAWPIAAVTGIVTFAFVLAATTTFQARVIAQERDRAEAALAREAAALSASERARAETEEVAAFQERQLSGLNPASMAADLRAGLVDKLRAADQRRGITDAEAAERVKQLESLMREVDLTSTSLEVLEAVIFAPALAVIRRDYAHRPLLQARLHQTLASTLAELGRYDMARAPQEHALATRRAELGADHPDTQTSLRAMGQLHYRTGEYDRAEPLFQQVLAKRTATLGSDHPDTLDALVDMGTLRFMQGHFEAAERYLHRALEKRRQALGPDHRDTIVSLDMMGVVLENLGQVDQAEAFHLEAVERSRQALGNDHPDTLVAVNNLGYLYVGQGRLDAAEPYYREALSTSRRVLGNDHPDTLISVNNMGTLLRDQGRLEEARRYFQEALETRHRTLGPEHPKTLNSMLNMAGLLLALGEPARAENYYRDAVSAQRRVLGPDHPYTLEATVNFSKCLNELGQVDEALALVRDAAHSATQTLTPGQPQWAAIQTAYADQLAAMARFEQAESLLFDTLGRISGGHTAGALPAEPVESLIELYTAWHAQSPQAGHDQRAARWQARRAALTAHASRAPRES